VVASTMDLLGWLRNKPFSSWAEIFGDAVAVAAMVDRLVHHAEIVSLKGDSYRLKDRRKEVASAE
jgi:DNA replication protein DnaC